VRLADWSFVRARDGRYRATIADRNAAFGLALTLAPTQPLLLHGDAGLSRKGPAPSNASYYVSEPQLEVSGELTSDARTRLAVRGRAWLDHEWSSSLMPERAVGWDWIGFNLDDGGALMAFRLRDAQGGAVWSGGTVRAAGGTARAFSEVEVRFEPLAWWTSAATRARYPVRWRIVCPAGTFEVRALLDAQELDARAVTGTVYWEGLSELRAADGRRVGLGYLEMTGYVSPLRLG
jgi:predicted secreted hydrolase